MCGICASISTENQVGNVISGLLNLEYRGYDSSGIAYIKNDKIYAVKSVGQIKNLEKKVDDISSGIVIGHTRWATHGKVSEQNAHPHFSESGKVAIVHNGIIENFEELKSKELRGVKFVSQTDTEVFANLIEKQKGSPIERLMSACKLVKGSFAVAVLFAGESEIYLAKRNSPLAVAVNEKCTMTASDISVFANKFESCFVLEDDEFAVLKLKNVDFFDKNGKKIDKKPLFINDIDFEEENLDKKHFMLKEINEQPMMLRKTYFKYFSEDCGIDFLKFKKFKSFHFVACGTAYHSCLMGARYIKQFCKKDCQVSIASEFRYDKNILAKNCLYIFVSQSGETADTIACAKLVGDMGYTTMAVTNVSYCSLNKIVDFVLPTYAGKEVAVASTKAYTAQVFTLLIFALKLSGKDFQKALKNFVLSFSVTDFQEQLIEEVCKFKKVFFIGRGQDYVASLEGALKLKEIGYLNCVGMAGGELKHGTLALIDDETLVVAISTSKALQTKLESNIQEICARGGKVLLLSQYETNITVDYEVVLKEFEEYFMPIVSIVPLQLLAFKYSVKLGYNPDKPRNLAKSVTVE